LLGSQGHRPKNCFEAENLGKKKQCEIEARVYDTFDDSDENFYFMAGDTSGGFPYGITWGEAIIKGYIDSEDELPEGIEFSLPDSFPTTTHHE